MCRWRGVLGWLAARVVEALEARGDRSTFAEGVQPRCPLVRAPTPAHRPWAHDRRGEHAVSVRAQRARDGDHARGSCKRGSSECEGAGQRLLRLHRG